MKIHKIATRPIRLDREMTMGSIGRLKSFLQEGYYSRNPDEPIGRNFVFIDKVINKDVNGNEFEVQVNYVGQDSDGSRMVLGGGSGKTRVSNKPAVIIFINSKMKPKTFTLYALGERLVNNLLEVLEHELTHQADIYSKKVDPSASRKRLPSEDEIDLFSYYNNPSEVRAYMRSIFDEIETYLPSASKVFTVRQVVGWIKGGSKTWNEISPHLNEDNRRLILKGVYQAVQDWYDNHGAITT